MSCPTSTRSATLRFYHRAPEARPVTRRQSVNYRAVTDPRATTDPSRSAVPARRLVAIYAVTAVAVASVAIGAISAGEERTPQPSIAGGYDLRGPDPCLGESFDVKQSGEFVNLDNADGTLGGRLRLEDGLLSGDVACTGGATSDLRAEAAGGRIAGTLDGRAIAAELKRDPPAPGTPRPRAPGSIDGEYTLAPRSSCLGARLAIEGSGSEVALLRGESEVGRARYADGRLSGEVGCPGGERSPVSGQAADRSIELTVGDERLRAEKRREAGSRFAAFFIAVAVVMLVARLFGMAAAALGQPRVMGEVLAGITLGPTLLGAFLPGVQSALFPSDIIPFIGVVAQLGLIFYMFLVGLEVDLSQIRGRVGQVAAISNVSVALPMMLGLAVALPIYELVGPDKKFVAFALFMGVSMSITAFPVLARILVERRMLKRPVGVLVLACAAVDDVTAWFLIALATAVAVAGSGVDVLETIVLAVIFVLVMGFAIRPLLTRVSTAYDEAGRVPGGWVALIFAGVLLSAYVTEEIGIALIFGAFVMGLIMPRHAELTEDVTRRIEDFVVTLLLPLFFTYTGLRTNIGLLDRPELWLMTGVLLLVAVVGKLFGAAIAARITGFDLRSSAVIGTLMNTRGLTELIVLNLALELGVISDALFAMLVLMALVTTFMAGPALRLLDPRNELGAPVEEELVEARDLSIAEFPALAIPEQSILVAPQSEGALEQLVSLAEPLARSEPPRELIVARLVRPPRGASARGGLQTENRLLRAASEEVNAARRELIERAVAARAVAFVSSDPGTDLARLARADEVALLLTDGRRPLLGEGVPRGDVGTVLREAPCDVAVLVAREGAAVLPSPGAGVVVPFGGVEHDWAALEVGAWIASATGAPLSLLGAAGQTDERARVSRLLGDAGLLVQQYAGIVAEPLVAEAGREGIVEAASRAGLLVIGLSDRWRDEGLGPTRSDIARAAPAPVLFVRRGTRPGALAPREDVTRFSWSAAGMGGRFTPGGPAG
jgi:Kef-type K+ transport system membrane component KefB